MAFFVLKCLGRLQPGGQPAGVESADDDKTKRYIPTSDITSPSRYVDQGTEEKASKKGSWIKTRVPAAAATVVGA